MRFLSALVCALALFGTAQASQCPSLVSKIDRQLENAQLDDGTRASIKALRDQGQDLHNRGDHSKSVEVLNKALDRLKTAS